MKGNGLFCNGRGCCGISVFHGAGTVWLTEIPTYAKIHGAWDAWKIFK